jgi:hypothetical protein
VNHSDHDRLFAINICWIGEMAKAIYCLICPLGATSEARLICQQL